MATMWDMVSDMFSSVSLSVGLFEMVVACVGLPLCNIQ